MRNDKFLLGIVAGMVALVIIALLLALLRPVGYQPEDSPAGVAHNYLLALQRGEMERAYGYLSPTLPNYPDFAAFSEDVPLGRFGMGRRDTVSLNVEFDPVELGDNRVLVQGRETFQSPQIFFYTEYRNDFTLTLEQQKGGWKLVSAERYWLRCWEEVEGCN